MRCRNYGGHLYQSFFMLCLTCTATPLIMSLAPQHQCFQCPQSFLVNVAQIPCSPKPVSAKYLCCFFQPVELLQHEIVQLKKAIFMANTYQNVENSLGSTEHAKGNWVRCFGLLISKHTSAHLWCQKSNSSTHGFHSVDICRAAQQASLCLHARTWVSLIGLNLATL